MNNQTHHTLPPAQLWIGKHEHIVQKAELFLQKTFCLQNGCQTCITCMHIRDKQHHAIMWLYPDKTYTIEQLDSIFQTIVYSLQPTEKFFFIIQKADFLTTHCANKLLKPMEEPPAGYHFILLAEHTDTILPTIKSRCTLHIFTTKNNTISHELLFQSFTTQRHSPSEFSKIIDNAHINERESIELFNEIMNYWINKTKQNNTPDQKTDYVTEIITILKKAHNKLPMPGSSLLFWRNVYLQLYFTR
jgi:DNA polymerase-3 subunit delta'